MIQTETYVIEPAGLIKSGTASYAVDLLTGVISYHADIKAGVGIFTKSFSFNGEYQVDPSLFVSEKLPRKLGEKVTVGPLTLSKGFEDYWLIDGPSLTGIGRIDTTGIYICGKSASIKAEVSGKQVDLYLRKSVPPKSRLSKLREDLRAFKTFCLSASH